jgi:hypothetical protein
MSRDIMGFVKVEAEMYGFPVGPQGYAIDRFVGRHRRPLIEPGRLGSWAGCQYVIPVDLCTAGMYQGVRRIQSLLGSRRLPKK